jgi:hypothetical protein
MAAKAPVNRCFAEDEVGAAAFDALDREEVGVAKELIPVVWKAAISPTKLFAFTAVRNTLQAG